MFIARLSSPGSGKTAALDGWWSVGPFGIVPPEWKARFAAMATVALGLLVTATMAVHSAEAWAKDLRAGSPGGGPPALTLLVSPVEDLATESDSAERQSRTTPSMIAPEITPRVQDPAQIVSSDQATTACEDLGYRLVVSARTGG